MKEKLIFKILLIFTVLPVPCTSSAATRLLVEEKPLGQIPSDMERKEIVISNDRSHAAFVIKKDGKEIVVLDGVEGKAYDYIKKRPYAPRNHYLIFSFNGENLGYIAGLDGKEIAVINSKEEKPYDEIMTDRFSFGPEGQSFAYRARIENKEIVVWNGAESKGYDDIMGPHLSPDGKRIAYKAQIGNKYLIVVDNQQGPLYDTVDLPFFSPDSRRLSYIAKRDSKRLMVLDGVEGPEYDEIQRAIYSSDGQHLAYIARKKDKWTVVLDGAEQGTYNGEIFNLVFSPDGKRFAYLVKQGDEQFMVVDGKKQKGYHKISGYNIADTGKPIFSPDSRHLAYSAQGKLTLFAVFGGIENFVVFDGIEKKRFSSGMIWTPVFSPDSQRFAYGVVREGAGFVVADDKKGKTYYGIDDIRFSPDSKQVAYEAALTRQKCLIVADGAEGPICDSIVTLGANFSPDSKHVVYIIRRGEDYIVVADNVEDEKYDDFLGYRQGTIVFDGPDSFHTIARKNQQLLLLQFRIVEE